MMTNEHSSGSIRPEWISQDLRALRERAARKAVAGAASKSPHFAKLVRKVGGVSAFESVLLAALDRTNFHFSNLNGSSFLAYAFGLPRKPALFPAEDAWHEMLMSSVQREIDALPEEHRRYGKYAVQSTADLMDGSHVSVHEICFENGMVAVQAVGGKASPNFVAGVSEAAGWVQFSSLAPKQMLCFAGKFVATTKLHKQAQASACEKILKKYEQAFAPVAKQLGHERMLKILSGSAVVSDLNSVLREVVERTQDREWVLTTVQVDALAGLQAAVKEEIRLLAATMAGEKGVEAEHLCLIPGVIYKCSLNDKVLRCVIYDIDHETMLASVQLEVDGVMRGHRWVPLSTISTNGCS